MNPIIVPRRHTLGLAAALCVMALVTAGCGEEKTSEASPTTEATTSTTADGTTTSAGALGSAAEGSIVNVWKGPAVDPRNLPIGTDQVSTSEAAVNGMWSCDGVDPRGGGAFQAGPWIDEAAGTWDSTKKISVQGEVSWPMAKYSENIEGDKRVIASNGVPIGMVTGTFPVAADDPAYSYDRNPNEIAERDLSLSVPTAPTAAATPSCLPRGPIGMLKNGVAMYAPADVLNRDAVAWEIQDVCDGHPEPSGTYHYHAVPRCVLDSAEGSSTVVGFANDGFPIVVESDAAGNLPMNADLDECHGRESDIVLDNQTVSMYHYSATLEFPYFIGCFHGTPITMAPPR